MKSILKTVKSKDFEIRTPFLGVGNPLVSASVALSIPISQKGILLQLRSVVYTYRDRL